jgi:hypothetical protein
MYYMIIIQYAKCAYYYPDINFIQESRKNSLEISAAIGIENFVQGNTDGQRKYKIISFNKETGVRPEF